MTAHIGFVNNGNGVLAHYNMLEKIRDVCVAEGWTVLRYDTVSANRELIMMAPGLSDTEQIYCGIFCYQDANNDYYNLAVATMKGYVAGNGFTQQPGISPISGVPAHNQRIDYWISVNKQRINVAMKVGTPVYCTFGIGKFFPYARPSQYPQPLIAAGMLVGTPPTRFSDPNYSMPWKGSRNNLNLNFNDGAWKQWKCHPFSNQVAAGLIRPFNSVYTLTPIQLHDDGNIYGQIDGIFHIIGFDNVVENTITVGGKNYVVLQDVGRTGFNDYIAMELS